MGEPRRVIIVGAGGIGFWLATGLARTGLSPIVFDMDNLEGGLGHQRLPLATPRTPKTALLTGFMRVNFGGNLPETRNERFTGREVHKGDLVVDCTDMNGVDRRKVWERARKRGARLLRVSYDGANSTVVVAEGLPFVLDESKAGYASVPSLALSLAAGGIGAEVVLRMLASELTCEHVEFQIDLADQVAQPSTSDIQGLARAHQAVEAFVER